MTKHWTQTPEGKKRMSEIQKLAHAKTKQAKNGTKRKYTKRRANGITVTIEGKDAAQAVKELISNVEYDRLKVRISIERQ